MDTEFSGAELLGIVSAVVAGIGAFLPWVTASVDAGPVSVGASATGIEGLGVLTLLVAAVAVGVILVVDWGTTGTVATAVAGLVVLLVGVWKVLDLGGPASPGLGLYLTVAGGLGIAAAGAWGFLSDSSDPSAGDVR